METWKNKFYKAGMSRKINIVCYRCENVGHFKKHSDCKAKDIKCGKWRLIGHFKVYCKTKEQNRIHWKKKNVQRTHNANAVEEKESYDSAL